MERHEISSVKLQPVTKFLFLQKTIPKEVHEDLMQILGGKFLQYSVGKMWCANFQNGGFETQEAAQFGKPSMIQ